VYTLNKKPSGASNFGVQQPLDTKFNDLIIAFSSPCRVSHIVSFYSGISRLSAHAYRINCWSSLQSVRSVWCPSALLYMCTNHTPVCLFVAQLTCNILEHIRLGVFFEGCTVGWRVPRVPKSKGKSTTV
jgi:hypothetical protein